MLFLQHEPKVQAMTDPPSVKVTLTFPYKLINHTRESSPVKPTGASSAGRHELLANVPRVIGTYNVIRKQPASPFSSYYGAKGRV
jgi:hypothetical protein